MTTADVSTTQMSLDELINQAGSPVDLLRSSPLGRYIFPGIPAEFTNWRDEVRASKQTVALLEQSYHMAELHLRGPDAIRLLEELAINRLKGFTPMKAKQIVMAGHDGNYIADAIIFHEEEEFYRIVGAPFGADWLEFNASARDYDIQVARDDSWSVHVHDRDVYRFQVQGPNAHELMRKITGGPLPEIKFFNMGEFRIAGKTVRALSHGMAGELGFELYGPWAEQHAVRDAIIEAGEEFGLRRAGADAYSVTGADSGWMPMPLPAIYSSDAMKPYREWLTGQHLEAVGSLGGSLISSDIEDYYVDPIELGYGMLIDPERDFLGRAALLERKANQKRRKIALKWNDEDVADVIGSSLFRSEGQPGKFIRIPSPMYATFQSDSIRLNGRDVGVSQWSCYTARGDTFLSGALVDVDVDIGTEVTLLWGEPGSRRASVEDHALREIRATVCASPYFDHPIRK